MQVIDEIEDTLISRIKIKIRIISTVAMIYELLETGIIHLQ